MFREHFPRVFELICLIGEREHPDAYFREFETRINANPDMGRAWKAREKEFAKLDGAAWDSLKNAARPYLIRKCHQGRGWSQLISILNEARGYIYLRDLGYQRIQFLPPKKINGVETPDLLADGKPSGALCEVKTIYISDDEMWTRTNIKARSTQMTLTKEFLKKLDDTLRKANNQLSAYSAQDVFDRIAFVILNFDDWLGEYKGDYYAQIDRHLAIQPQGDYRVVFFNNRTPFHKHISMHFATVVNE